MKKNLGQLDDVFKLLTEVYEHHYKLLSLEKQHADSQLFEDVDEKVFSFEHSV